MINIHASSIVYKNKGILIIGDSGFGKSDLCFRLIMNKSAKLIADDRTDLCIKNNEIYASCPKPIRGLLEIRGIGIKKFDFVEESKIDLAIDLVNDFNKIERIPDSQYFDFKGIKIPKIRLHAFESSVLEKIDISLV